jgi:hypothetical protein
MTATTSDRPTITTGSCALTPATASRPAMTTTPARRTSATRLTVAICRTPGFWGTHAGTEKSPGKGQSAVNITKAVLNGAEGNCADLEFDAGLCSGGGADNCHQPLLVNESLGLNFEPRGWAGSADGCNSAKKTLVLLRPRICVVWRRAPVRNPG